MRWRASADADVVAFAGDVSSDLEQAFDFMDKARQGKPAIFVAGNHEYEGKSVERAKEAMARLSEQSGVVWLDGQSVEIGGVVFAGATLWSGFGLFPGLVSEAMSAARFAVCDFTSIALGGKPLDPEGMAAMHKRDAAALGEIFASCQDKPVAALTHFAPFRGALSKKRTGELSSAYWVNALDDELGGLCEAWMHGHVHDSLSFDCMGTKVWCNPRGAGRFYDLDANAGFKRDMLIGMDDAIRACAGLGRKPKA